MSSAVSHLQGEETAHPKRVIVIDDNEILLRAWKRILSHMGCVCFASTNPEAALEEIERDGADLLICDIVMPRIDGFEVIQRLQQLSQHPRIVLTTGYVCDFKRLKLDVGDQDIHVLLKPYDNLQEIRRFVQRLLDGDHSLDEEDTAPTHTLDDTRVHLWSL